MEFASQSKPVKRLQGKDRHGGQLTCENNSKSGDAWHRLTTPKTIASLVLSFDMAMRQTAVGPDIQGKDCEAFVQLLFHKSNRETKANKNRKSSPESNPD